jgi:hypothetical protein
MLRTQEAEEVSTGRRSRARLALCPNVIPRQRANGRAIQKYASDRDGRRHRRLLGEHDSRDPRGFWPDQRDHPIRTPCARQRERCAIAPKETTMSASFRSIPGRGYTPPSTAFLALGSGERQAPTHIASMLGSAASIARDRGNELSTSSRPKPTWISHLAL